MSNEYAKTHEVRISIETKNLSHFCHSENVIKRDQKTSYVNVLIRDIL